jgi:hypothetical protein
MARFTPALHPRGKDGKFVSRGGGAGSRPRTRSTSRNSNLGKVLAAKAIYDDVTDVASHGAKAYAYGATGNYVKSALHGAKASTATARLGSRAAGAYVRNNKSIAPGTKRKFEASRARFDDRVQTVDNAATIGLVLTGGALRKKSSAGTNGVKGIGSGSRGLKPAKVNRQGVHQITKVKRTTAGARVRR